MKNKMDKLLKIQAYFDNELGPGEAREIEQLLVSETEAQTIGDFIRKHRETLRKLDLEHGYSLPIPFEVYWASIRSRITQPSMIDVISGAILDFVERVRSIRRTVAPVTVIAVCLILCILAGNALTRYRSQVSNTKFEIVALVKDPGVVTYRDWAQGVTLVWFPYPANGE